MRAAPGPRFPPRRRLSAPTGSRACPHASAGFLVAGETAANKPSPRTSALTHLRRWAEGEGRAARRPVGPRAWEKAEAAAPRGAGGRLGRVDRQPAGRGEMLVAHAPDGGVIAKVPRGLHTSVLKSNSAGNGQKT